VTDTVIYPNAMVILTTNRKHFMSLSKKSKITLIHDLDHAYHSQNTSFTNPAMMCTGRLIMRTFLAISQISTLLTVPKKNYMKVNFHDVQH
jgi:hypothetical protein